MKRNVPWLVAVLVLTAILVLVGRDRNPGPGPAAAPPTPVAAESTPGTPETPAREAEWGYPCEVYWTPPYVYVSEGPVELSSRYGSVLATPGQGVPLEDLGLRVGTEEDLFLTIDGKRYVRRFRLDP
ncbi:MAG: hypothetical protein AB1758_07530 [Candidatus Eremiobacterota bacterium]